METAVIAQFWAGLPTGPAVPLPIAYCLLPTALHLLRAAYCLLLHRPKSIVEVQRRPGLGNPGRRQQLQQYDKPQRMSHSGAQTMQPAYNKYDAGQYGGSHRVPSEPCQQCKTPFR